jgi:hypothetical protein
MPAMKKFLITFSCIALGVLAGVAGGCGDDDEAGDCAVIADTCHSVQTAPAQACHESAEDEWTEAECTTNKASCLALCSASGADAGSFR